MADPVDTQNVFSRTVQVQRIQQNLQNQLINDQDEFADQMRKTSDDRQEQVSETGESDMQRTEDGQEENRDRRGGARERSGERGEADDAPPPDPVRGHHIDVEI